jgi:hypothetical protein
MLSVREVCLRLGELLNRPVRFTGVEGETAFLSDARKGFEALGPPRVDADRLIRWVADWIGGGGRSLNKPTHFEEREGRY